MQSKILIVEDNPLVRTQLETILAPVDAELHFVNTVKKALDLLRYMEFAVVMTDLHTPDRSGFSFIREVTGNTRTADTYIILMNTPEHEAETVINAYRAGAVDFITKPFREAIVRSRVELYIRLYKKRKHIDELLHNIFPPAIADEIKQNGKTLPKRFGSATVMFADFKAFSVKAIQMAPVELVNRLDWFFNEFDKIISRYSIEKIKTIGDAYMCVCGIPSTVKEDALQMVMAAFDITRFMEKEKRRCKRLGLPYWELRIGIHTGPLVAGVIGRKKMAYDTWGNTVNTAARLEGSGETGKIHISEETWKQVKPYIACILRGEMEVKYIGKIKTYFADSILPLYSVGRKGKVPSQKLKQIAGLIDIDFEKLKELVLAALRNELGDELYYHGVHHTTDVMYAVRKIGKEYELPYEEQLLLDTAALLHDTGYLKQYNNNEAIAIKYAQKILPSAGYSTGQVKLISGIINTTKTKAVPKTLLQKIMNDADYDYLGREDYFQVAETLFLELKTKNKQLTEKGWLKMQIDFLKKHRYYTKWAIENREPLKKKNLELLKKKYRQKAILIRNEI